MEADTDGAGLTLTDRKDKQALQNATAAAEAQGVPVQHVPKHDLNIITNQRPHQVRAHNGMFERSETHSST